VQRFISGSVAAFCCIVQGWRWHWFLWQSRSDSQAKITIVLFLIIHLWRSSQDISSGHIEADIGWDRFARQIHTDSPTILGTRILGSSHWGAPKLQFCLAFDRADRIPLLSQWLQQFFQGIASWRSWACRGFGRFAHLIRTEVFLSLNSDSWNIFLPAFQQRQFGCQVPADFQKQPVWQHWGGGLIYRLQHGLSTLPSTQRIFVWRSPGCKGWSKFDRQNRTVGPDFVGSGRKSIWREALRFAHNSLG